MRISIQQPEYFPWLGFFDKIRQVDHVVLLDNVQFKKRYFENRNRIRTDDGWQWIRTPVITRGRYHQDIRDVEIDYSQPWRRKLVESIRHGYARAPHWPDLGPALMDCIRSASFTRLRDFNLAVITFLCERMALNTPWSLASELNTRCKGSALILEICEKVGATAYLSGRDGRNYLQLDSFQRAGIAVTFQEFVHPRYPQCHPGAFLPAMSAIDLLFNEGESSQAVLKGER